MPPERIRPHSNKGELWKMARRDNAEQLGIPPDNVTWGTWAKLRMHPILASYRETGRITQDQEDVASRILIIGMTYLAQLPETSDRHMIAIIRHNMEPFIQAGNLLIQHAISSPGEKISKEDWEDNKLLAQLLMKLAKKYNIEEQIPKTRTNMINILWTEAIDDEPSDALPRIRQLVKIINRSISFWRRKKSASHREKDFVSATSSLANLQNNEGVLHTTSARMYLDRKSKMETRNQLGRARRAFENSLSSIEELPNQDSPSTLAKRLRALSNLVNVYILEAYSYIPTEEEREQQSVVSRTATKRKIIESINRYLLEFENLQKSLQAATNSEHPEVVGEFASELPRRRADFYMLEVEARTRYPDIELDPQPEVVIRHLLDTAEEECHEPDDQKELAITNTKYEQIFGKKRKS